MATVAARTVFPHITTDPGVGHGRPCIAGTRVRVMDIVAAREQGVSPEELQDDFATRPLTLAEAERVAAEGLAAEADHERRSGR